jgi:hypothetical protein
LVNELQNRSSESLCTAHAVSTNGGSLSSINRNDSVALMLGRNLV